MDSQVDGSLTQVAIKPFQCSLARGLAQRETILKPICVDLRRLALGGQTLHNLRSLA